MVRPGAPAEPSNAHQHEWHVREDESALLYEDGAVFIEEDCEYVEITGSSYSEKHDETFYGTGYECDATRRHRFDLTGIERLHGVDDAHKDIHTICDGRDKVLSLYDHDPMLVEEIELAARERLCEDADEPPLAFNMVGFNGIEQRKFQFTIERGGETYRLTYEHDETTVDGL